jgi:zinc protease
MKFKVTSRIALSCILLVRSVELLATTSTQKSYEAITASNGLTVLALPMKKVPLVTIVLVAKAGAMTETQDTNGLTHVWEHMFFKGNQRLPNQEAFNKRVRQLGISFNGDTSPEMVRYYFTLPSKNLSAGLQFMADAIGTPLLEPAELERERKVVLDEYDRNASQPFFELNNIERMLIYGPQEFLRNPLGRRRLIEKTTREQLLKIKDEVFVPANSALIVSGDVETKTLIQLVNQHFAKWKTPDRWRPINRGPFPEFPQTTDITKTHSLAQNVTMQITWKGPSVRREPQDTWAADTLIQLLEHRSGKFFKKYIDSGLTLNAGLGYHTQAQAGELTLYAMTNTENAIAAKTSLLAEINEWTKPNYFTTTQLQDVRKRIKVSRKMELNKPSEFGKTMAFWWAITGLDYYDSYLTAMDKVSLAEIQTFVRKYFIAKPYVGITLLSPKDAETANIKDNSGPFADKFLKNY